MGSNCCSNSSAEKAYTTDSLDKRSKWRVQKEAQIEEIAKQTSIVFTEFTPAHVLYVQNYMRGYLALKRLKAAEGDWMDFSEDESVPAQATSEANIDPVTLLTPKAQETLGKLAPFSYGKQVQGVQPQPSMYLVSGGIYIGQWSIRSQGTVPKGKGKFYGSDGGYKEGYWKNGVLHLKGRIILPNGDCYMGDIRRGERSGAGTLTSFREAQVYTGRWKRGVRSGKGEETYSNGSTYIGHFKRDEKNGKGTIRWKDGSFYQGDFKDDQITGTGVFTWANGRIYTGTVLNGKMHGKGKFQFPDGSVYVGEYENDKKSGKGAYKWADGEYEGEWKMGKMHGVGWLRREGKERKKYVFEQGTPVREVE